MALFRERLLAELVKKRAISKKLVAKLVACRHPGFSTHVGDRIAAEDKQRLDIYRRLQMRRSSLEVMRRAWHIPSIHRDRADIESKVNGRWPS